MNNKICLIHPDSHWLIDGKASPSLGLLYIASYVRDVLKYPIQFVDFASGDTLKDIPTDCNYYGITSTTPQWPAVQEMIREIKKDTPSTCVIVGGSHPTALPDLCIADGADIVVCGEGELALKKIIEGNLRCGVYRENRNFDLDDLPFPARDLVSGYTKNTIICSRGCPYGCEFCCSKSIWGGKVTVRSVGNVMKEVEYVRNRYGDGVVTFQDETFGLNKKWLNEFCEEIKKVGVKWEVQTRAKLCSEEFVSKLSEAGCVGISLGIESGSDKMLKLYKKDDIDSNLRAIETIVKYGVKCRGFFIVGLPGETDDSVEETKRFLIRATEIGLDRVLLSAFIPYPGCELYDKNVTETFDKYFHHGSKEFGYASFIGDRASMISKWKNYLHEAVGEFNEYKQLEMKKGI